MAARDLRARRLEDLITQLLDRVRRLEHRRRVLVGPYLLDVNEDGQLTARHSETGTVTVIASP